MRIGDWVHTCHDMNKITGFVTSAFNECLEIYVTIPQGYGKIIAQNQEIIPGDDTIWMDDLPTLIDLSLKIKDEEWFQKWRHELSLWRPIGNKTDRLLHGLFFEA